MQKEESDQTSGPETPVDVANVQSRKARLLDQLVLLRSAVLSITLVSAIVAVLIVVVRDLARAPIVLEELGVTETLSKEGYTGLIASNMLWDEIEEIREFTGNTKNKVRIQTASRQLDVVEPGSGLSLQRVTLGSRLKCDTFRLRA